jgi:hypothetical protein
MKDISNHIKLLFFLTTRMASVAHTGSSPRSDTEVENMWNFTYKE